ncbi:MAG: phosphotransferase family protein [Pseudomonadales bacterium]|nr:phosphotransferase family protein [Pseudomonadales bacterium]MCP5183768.1 phosphotransferase family protein [Pseudomonadales bacterium]
MSEFQSRLEAVLAREIAEYRGLVSCERLSGGASQETYRIVIRTEDGDRKLCMRRAPGGVKVETVAQHPGLATEALLMRVAREAGVPEPEVRHVLTDDDGLGDGFLMEWLEGEALGARIVRSPDFDAIRPKLAYLCGQALARIHAVDLEASGLSSRLGRLTAEEFVHQTWDRYKLLGTPQPMIDYAGKWLLANLPKDVTPALVHNDFRNGNIMFDQNGIVAVLDWEVAHIGDPMRDLGWICTNSWRFGRTELPVGGFGEYADLFAGYESVSGTPVDPERVRFWEVFGSFWWATGCLGMAEHYRSGPDKTVERPGIGRRSSECQVDCVNLLIPGPVRLLAPRPDDDGDMPRLDELLVSVRDFLHKDVMAATQGRTNFLARVAGNSLDIVLRDLAVGPQHRAEEKARLKALVGGDGDVKALRTALVEAIRNGSLPLHDAALIEHLRQTVVNQVAIDQPRYSGFRTAASRAVD